MSAIKENKVLETIDLSIGYKSKKQQNVLAKHLDLCLKQGELVCILGKNGIGKSTLIKSLCKVLPTLSGKVTLKNKSLADYNSLELSKSISIVLTDKIPPSNLTVYELIALGRQPYTNWLDNLTEEDHHHINFAIEQTDLIKIAHDRCDELSDGQLQRVMICRALAQNTEMIILDEPTIHLDIQYKIETFKLLKNLAHQLNKTVLISTHEVQLALQTADCLWLMTSNGLITGDPNSLIENDDIDQLFDQNIIHFDKKSRQFLIN